MAAVCPEKAKEKGGRGKKGAERLLTGEGEKGLMRTCGEGMNGQKTGGFDGATGCQHAKEKACERKPVFWTGGVSAKQTKRLSKGRTIRCSF